MAYVFIRKAESNPPDYGQIAQAGATVALNAEDPNLAGEIAKAQQAGAKFAIWLPAHQGQDPTQYGQHMAALAQHYKPDAILPNLEGMQNKASSGGADWGRRMMAEFSRYVPPGSLSLAVVTEAGEKDFDYSPFINYGGGVINEAFIRGASGPKDYVDPDKMRQNLIDAGVPPDRINMLLAPGQQPGSQGTFSAYTWDDMNASQRESFLSNYATHGQDQGWTTATSGGTGGTWVRYRPSANSQGYSQVPSASPPQGGEDQYSQVPDVGPASWSKVLDRNNPAALRYSQQQLARLLKMGYHPEDYGLGSLDPTAQWRAMSAILGAQQAISAGHGADYTIPPNTPPEIVAQIAKMQEAAATPNTAVPGDDTIHPGGAGVPPNPELPASPSATPQPGKQPMNEAALAMIRQAALTRARSAAAAHAPVQPTPDAGTIRPGGAAPPPATRPLPLPAAPVLAAHQVAGTIDPAQRLSPAVPTAITNTDIVRLARSRAIAS